MKKWVSSGHCPNKNNLIHSSNRFQGKGTLNFYILQLNFFKLFNNSNIKVIIFAKRGICPIYLKMNDMKKDVLYICDYPSPVGTLLLAATNRGLAICAVKSVALKQNMVEKTMNNLDLNADRTTVNGVLNEAMEWLDNFFAGRDNEKRLPLLMVGSLFQKKVWTELLKISYGTTVSYSQVANRIGNPKAVRAVANAVGANRLWIVVPCHRVIGADGSLTGYAGGLDAKRFLISLESRG